MTELEVIPITCSIKSLIGRIKKLKGLGIKEIQKANQHFQKDKRIRSVRATLHAPLWTKYGWSELSRGRVFYYSPFRTNSKMNYGTNLIADIRNEFQNKKMPKAKRAHMIAHRYSIARENIKNMLTYHALVLIESTWEIYNYF